MAMFSEAPRGGSGDMEAPQKMRRHGQYFAKPIPVVNERLLRGSGVCEESRTLRLRLNYRPSAAFRNQNPAIIRSMTS